MRIPHSLKAPLPPCFAWSPSPAAAGGGLGFAHSVPLRGCGFEIYPQGVFNDELPKEVSVPLRGCGFEMRFSLSFTFTPCKFPSPCGDVLYSPPPSDGGGGERCEPVGALTADVPFSRWRYADRSRRPFHHASHGPPPPLRQGRLGFAFPSPCGDVVLKSWMSYWAILEEFIVSVPLRGCGFEISFARSLYRSCFASFPSPCGDVVLKSIIKRTLIGGLDTFPSPCGDVVLKSLPREVLRCVAQSAVLRRGCVSPPFSCGNTFYKQLYPARLYVRRGSPLQYSTEPPAVQAASCAWARLIAASARRAALSQDNASSHARRCPRGR